jgi:hypothetical protein
MRHTAGYLSDKPLVVLLTENLIYQEPFHQPPNTGEEQHVQKRRICASLNPRERPKGSSDTPYMWRVLLLMHTIITHLHEP